MLLFLNKIWRIGGVIILGGYAALAVLIWQIPNTDFKIYFLNVGQGDSIFIKTPENHQILIDGGPKNYVLAELDKVMPFFDKSLDMVVLTHPHADHVDGLVEVLKRYDVGMILMTGVDYKSPDYEEFLKVAAAKNIKIMIAKNDKDFKFGNVVFDLLYPSNPFLDANFKNVNNSSIVMKILYGGKKILLTGDMELEEESLLMKTGLDLKADILKVGHHGSKTSSSKKFLNLVNPEIAIIQSGKGNSFGHPHEETLRNLKDTGVNKIYRNDIDGRIEISL